MAVVKDLGVVTAYAYAVAGGYAGTEAEFTDALGRAGIVVEQLENLTAAATTLSEGAEATASYADGVLTFGIPKGDTGATGPQGEQGVKGDTGNGIVSIAKTGASGLVDTYTITFTDGSTTTFAVTNGADGDITNVAQAFDATKAYSAGDMVLYQGTLYTFTAAHAAGAWVGSDAQAVILADEVTALKDDLNNVAEIMYPNTDVVVASVPSTSQATANNYYTISKLKAGNAYRIMLTISDATHLSNVRTSKAESGSGNVDNITNDFVGESWVSGKTVIYTPAVEDIQYLQVQFNSAYVADEASISITVYDYTKETTTAIQELETANTEIIEAVDAIAPEIYLEDEYNLLPPFGYTVNKLITVAGVVRDYAGDVLSDYIPIDPTQGYICNYTKTASVVYGNSALTGNLNTFDRNCFCFFDENKNVVPFTGDTTAVSKAIPENARYIRVTINSEELYPFARLIYGNYETQPIVRICDYHKRIGDFYAESNTGFEQFKMVMFGDSITHGSLSAGDNGISYVDYANDYLHSNIINVGFGGTRMTYSLSGAGLFCFYNLCDCIVSDDPNAWDDLIDYATNSNTTYLPHLNKLMAIDWTKVDAIGLMYGANDYASNTPVGSSYNETITNFDGACAYGLKKLLTKYPHLQVLILTPFDREMTAGDASTMTDVAQNTAGLLISDYADSLLNVQSRFHCPVIDTGKLFGINQYNILTYAPDGTHPRANIAQKRLGWLFAKAVENNLAPFN